MKNFLNYFEIEGEFGGNQDWFTNIVMRMGGCAAVTACDSCIYFAREYGLKSLYPYEEFALNKADYKAFSMKMKPFLKPRKGGISRLEIFIDGFKRYLSDTGIHIEMKGLSGNRSFEEAKCAIRDQISKGLPVPYLLLKHKNKAIFKDFIWHWFLIVGFEDKGEDLLIRTATYGEEKIFSLKEMWETGFEEKGGIILYSLDN